MERRAYEALVRHISQKESLDRHLVVDIKTYEQGLRASWAAWICAWSGRVVA